MLLIMTPDEMEYWKLNNKICGFTIFNYRTVGNSFIYEHLYFTYCICEEIVGVLKLVKKAHLNGFDNIWIVSFIDVREDHRCCGVASYLYNELNNWVTSDMIICGTEEDGLGKTIGMHKLRSRYITNCINVNTYYDIYNL